MRGSFKVLWINLSLAAIVSLSFVPVGARADSSLSLENYLGQVKGKNEAVKGAVEASKASVERRAEKDLPLAPTLYANVTLQADAKLPQLPFFSYDQLNYNSYSLGVSQATNFGLLAKLSYNLDYTSFLNPSLPGGNNLPFQFYDVKPQLELSQSIWGNGFGANIRANQDLIEAQTKASEFSSKFQVRNLILQAEGVYWRLAFARESIDIEQHALDQSKEIYDYTLRRERSHLGETADTLQAKAAWELRKLTLRSAEDEARAAARAFNALRNIRANVVEEELIDVTTETIISFEPPARAKMRDDVAAAQQQVAASTASSVLAVEKIKPTLDVFASIALNGRDTSMGPTFGNSYSAGRPTKVIGAKLSIPLDFEAADTARHGAIRERDAAEMSYQQKLMDQEQSWEDLVQKLGEAKDRLLLSVTIEKAQQAKMNNERKRLTVGRTTTFQVLLFEQDLSASQLGRLRAQADVVNIFTQMKLFSAGEL